MKNKTITQLVKMANETKDLELLKVIRNEIDKRNQVIEITFGEYQNLKLYEKEYEKLCLEYNKLYELYNNLTYEEEFPVKQKIGFKTRKENKNGNNTINK